jgi:hypothetical protein
LNNEAMFMGNGGMMKQFAIRRAALQIGGRGQAMPAGSTGTLELRDAKGSSFQMISQQQQYQQAQVFNPVGGAVPVMEQELVFQPNAGQAAPAKLVYLGQRTTTINVPFTLKDVTVP